MQPEKHSARLLAASDTLRSGALERLVIDEAIAIADAIGDERLAYADRLRLISSCTLNGDTEARLAAVDWCLAKHLSDPQQFAARIENLDLIWEFTTIPDTIAASPEFDRTVVVDTLATLRSLLQHAGVGLSALRFAQVRVARILGTETDLATARRNLLDTPLDDYSPCPTCRQSEHAFSLAETGRPGEAAAAFDLLFNSPGSCAFEPELSYARSLKVYLQAGQAKKAARSHQLGYELIKNNPAHLALLAQHIDYCRMADRLDDGLTLLERHLGWLDSDPLNALGRFEALAAMGALFDALGEAGRGESIIRFGDFFARLDRQTSAANAADPAKPANAGSRASDDLCDDRCDPPDDRPPAGLTVRYCAGVCWRAAAALADEFDQRNQATTFRERMVAGPTPQINVHPAVRARLAQTTSARPGSVQASFASLDRAVPSSDLWLQLARERATVEDTPGAESAIRLAHDALDSEQGALAGQAAARASSPEAETSRQHHVLTALLALEITLALEHGETAKAESLAGARADLLIEDDRLDLAEVELQVGLLLFGADQPSGSGTLEHALTSARKAHVEAEAEVCILNALAELRLKQGRPAEARAFMLTAVKRCGHDPDNVGVLRPLVLLAHAQMGEGDFGGVKQTANRLLRHTLDRATKANALLLRASACHGLAELNAAIADADRALSLYLELGYSKGIIDACTRLALLLEELGVQAGVAEAWRQAVTEAERTDHTETGVIRFRLARALITAGAGEEAAAELDTVLENTVRARAPDTEISEVLYWLGHAYRLADDDELAYCSWSVALTRAAASMDARGCVRLGLALGRLLLDADDESSIDVLDETVAQARQLDAPWELVDALHLLGQAQCEFGHSEGLRALDEAVSVADQHAFDVDALVASVTESKAHGFDALGRDAEALEAARRSAKLYERLGERSSAGLARLFAARLLTAASRTVEAEAEYQKSVELLANDTAAAAAVSRELRVLSAGAA